MTSKAVVIYSGGMDSLTALRMAINEGYDVHALSVNYGQRHSIELEYAKRQCDKLEIPHRIVELAALRPVLTNSALTDVNKEMPHGHYAAENMKQTVVPNRNAILINVAVAYAVNIGAEAVYAGMHAGDHFIYPDCRPAFIEPMGLAIQAATEGSVYFVTPFLYISKTDIAMIGKDLGIDYTEAWTCYDPQNRYGVQIACGLCGACQERKEAMRDSGAMDEMVYADE